MCVMADRRRGSNRACVVLVALALTAGCTGTDGVDPGPSEPARQTSTTSPSSVPSTNPTREATAGEYDLQDAAMDWFTSAGPSEEVRNVYDLTHDRMVVTVADASGDRVVVLAAGSRAEYQVPTGQIVQNAYLVGDDVVFDTAAADTDDYWITRWEPDTGATQTIYQATGDDAWFSETAVDGTDLYLDVRGDGDTECVARLDLSAPDPVRRASTVACTEPGLRAGWLRVTDGALTFLAGTQSTACPTMYRVTLPAGRPEKLAVDGCVSRGIADANWIVWSEPPPVDADGYANYFDARLRVQTGDGVHDLGAAVTGSTAVCDGALYWTWDDMEAPLEPSQIRRWTPDGGVEVVYRSPDGSGLDRYATSGVSCRDGVVTFQRFGWWGNAGQELMTSRPLDWTPTLNSAGLTPGRR